MLNQHQQRLLGVLGLATLAATLGLLALSLSPPERTELGFFDDDGASLSSYAHWDETRLPHDSQSMLDLPSALRAGKKSTSQAVMTTLAAAHLGSTRMPRDIVSKKMENKKALQQLELARQIEGEKEAAVPEDHFRISRELAGSIADNKASALRTKSFKWVLKDCEKKASCKELLGSKLWRVMKTKSHSPNLSIYHDQDDDRREEERSMEQDYRKAKRQSSLQNSEVSAIRWQKLKADMADTHPSDKVAKAVNAKIEQIEEEDIPKSEKRILENAILRSSRVDHKAATLTEGYKDETDLVFGSSGSKGAGGEHWSDYKPSMLPTSADAQEENTQNMLNDVKPSESEVLSKYQNKAKALLQKEAKGQVLNWEKKASRMLKRQREQGSKSEAKTETSLKSTEKARDKAVETNEQREIDEELNRYASPIEEHDRQQRELHKMISGQEKLRHDRRKERAFQRKEMHRAEERERRKEAKAASSELKSYDLSFPHTPSLRDPFYESSSGKALSARMVQLSQMTPAQRAEIGAPCYLSSGQKVACSKLSKLGRLMKEIYGKKAKDISIVAKDKSFDPTKVYASKAALDKATRKQVFHGGQSDLGKLLHQMNEKAVTQENLKIADSHRGPFGHLSQSLGSAVGW